MVFATRPLARLARRAPLAPTGSCVELRVVEWFTTGALSRASKAVILPTGVGLEFTAGHHCGRLVVDSCWNDLDGAHVYYAVRYVEAGAGPLAGSAETPLPKELGRWSVRIPTPS